MAFLLVDIEAFKTINAEAGRMIGDRVLRTVGRAIQASTRGTDFVGRIGGDEFAVVLGECADPRPAVERIFVALHGETTGGDHPPPRAHAAVDPVQLFRIAEDALASVRGSGRARAATRDYPVEAAVPASVGLTRG
jgi:GGDEF domain-containing protein